MAASNEYAWAAGHNVALASLTAIDTLGAFTYGGIGVQIVSNPVIPYPVRTRLQSGRERMDGRIDHQWRIPHGLKIDAVDYIIDTFFASPNGFDAPVTINTRLHDRGTWARYNAYIRYPMPDEDYRLEQGYVFDLVIRFYALTLAA